MAYQNTSRRHTKLPHISPTTPNPKDMHAIHNGKHRQPSHQTHQHHQKNPISYQQQGPSHDKSHGVLALVRIRLGQLAASGEADTRMPPISPSQWGLTCLQISWSAWGHPTPTQNIARMLVYMHIYILGRRSEKKCRGLFLQRQVLVTILIRFFLLLVSELDNHRSWFHLGAFRRFIDLRFFRL